MVRAELVSEDGLFELKVHIFMALYRFSYLKRRNVQGEMITRSLAFSKEQSGKITLNLWLGRWLSQ